MHLLYQAGSADPSPWSKLCLKSSLREGVPAATGSENRHATTAMGGSSMDPW